MKYQLISALCAMSLICQTVMAPVCFAAEESSSTSSDVVLNVETEDTESIIKIKVPLQIPISLSKEGNASIDQSLAIENVSDVTPVTLSELTVSGKSGWQIMDFATNFEDFAANEKKLAMSFRGSGTNASGAVDLISGWSIEPSSKVLLEAKAKLPVQTESIQESIATVNYVFTATSEDTSTEPSPGVISNDWAGDPVLKTSVTPVTFTYNEGSEGATLTSVKSLNPEVAEVTPVETANLASDQQVVYNVTAVGNGKTTIEGSLSDGTKTTFDVSVYSLNIPGADGSGAGGTIEVPSVDKQPGDAIATGDVQITIPTTDGSEESQITVTPEIPEDTVLEEGKNTIEVTVEVDGVTVTLNIVITVVVKNPSDGLQQSIEEAQAMGFTFSSFEDGLQIDSFENKQFKSEINIPEQIGDFKVLKIGDNAFKDQSNLKKVTLPSTITIIGKNAFSGCSGATSINIPNGVTSIGSSAFYKCGSLEYITLPSSVTSIDYSAFAEAGSAVCDAFIACDIPGYSKTGGVFSGATFDTVVFEDSGITIGQYAFFNASIKNLTLPGSVSAPLLPVFQGAGAENSTVCTDYLVPNLFSSSNFAHAVIGSSVTQIPEGAFKGSSQLLSVEIPDTVISVGNHAFDGCSSLQSITFPDSITEIGADALYQCSALTSVKLSSKLTALSDRLFYGCESLTTLQVPDSVISLGENVFYCCVSLSQITLPPNLDYIGVYAFSQCRSLESIDIPDTVTYIDTDAFYFCNGLKEITLPASVKTFGKTIFRKAGSPEGTLYVACNLAAGTSYSDLILGDAKFSTVVFMNGVTEIPSFTCFEFENLASVVIPDTVTTIGKYAFYQCPALQELSVPATVTSIGSNAFYSVPHIYYNGPAEGSPWGALAIN